MRRLLTPGLIAAALALPLATWAADHDHAAHTIPALASPAAPPWVDATVKKLDKAAGKITLAHGPLTNLDMGAMTMAFRVKEKAWLDKVKEGDKIRIAADNIKGELTVVRLEAGK